MALNKDRSAIVQLIANGTSLALDLTASYSHTLYIRHTNGTGTITTGATIRVRVKPFGGTYIDLTSLVASLTPSTIDPFVCRIPDDAVSVQLIYSLPTGGTGHALDAEVGMIIAV